MDKLIIDRSILKKGHLLCVTFDKEKGIFKLYGYMLENEEETNNHFIKINNWINNYIEEPNEKTDFYFQFEYINTLGIKKVYEVIEKLRVIPEIRFFIVHDPDDIDFEEMATDISNNFNLNALSKKVSLDYQAKFYENAYFI